MSQRFISNVALAIAGAVVVVASQAFSSSLTGWLTFGVSLGALALLAVVQRDRARGRLQRMLHVSAASHPKHLRESNPSRHGARGIESVFRIDQGAKFLSARYSGQ